MKTNFRVRVSTVFLCAALLALPISAGWVAPPWPDLGPRGWLLTWVLYDFIPAFFIVALVAALIGLVVAARRNQPLNQFIVEMLVALGAFLLLPVY